MEIYHVLNRGVEKRDVVLDDNDRMRFIRSLYLFNDTKNAPNSVSQPVKWQNNKQRVCLVNIHAWCLMNNHYHLLLSPAEDDLKNISLFMKKLNMGYAKFFNEKYERSGYLWQGKYKKILINNDSQFQYIPYYIHLNPLDYTNYEWRSGKVSCENQERIHEQLLKYRWSSYLDYNGSKNFPSLIYTDLISKILIDKPNQDKQIKFIVSGNETIHTSIIDKLEM